MNGGGFVCGCGTDGSSEEQEDSVGVGPVPGRGEGYRVDGTGSHLEQGGGEGRASGR